MKGQDACRYIKSGINLKRTENCINALSAMMRNMIILLSPEPEEAGPAVHPLKLLRPPRRDSANQFIIR